MTITVSAPGKIILMGEHAAVYGKPALVAAIDRRAWARLKSEPGINGLRLCLPDLELEQSWSWSDLRNYAEDRRICWQRWFHDRTRPFHEVLGEQAAHLVATALGETLLHAGARPHGGACLTLSSEIPIGSGFGSSAAVATVVVAAMAAYLRLELDSNERAGLVLEVERRQHGTPSGVDGAAVAHGGVVWAIPSSAPFTGPSVQPVAAHPSVLKSMRVAHSGAPPESTGEVVAAVRSLRERDREEFDLQLSAAAQATEELKILLGQPGKSSKIVDCWRRFSAWLCTIGVVPQEVRELIERVEEAGGAAKISGAGSLAGPGAGSFMVYHPAPSTADRLIDCEGLTPLQLRLGGPGLQREDMT